MKNKTLGNLSLSLVACAVLAGCGSDDKDDLPTVSVAAAVALKENRSTTIAATAADDDEVLTYAWTQVSGPTLALTATTSATVGVTAPAVSADGAAVLRVTVTDQGNQTASADVTVNVANNVLPTVTATFDAAAEKSDVTLTAVAEDEDGEISSYSWTQTSGDPVTLTGADTATLSFTAPSVTADTDLTFSLTVTDDDDESAAVEGTVTVTPVMTTFTVTGTVSGVAFADAEVSGELAGETFTTTADAEGAFSLALEADDDETNLFANLTASSVVTPGVEYYKFIPSLTATAEETPAGSIVDKVSAAVATLLDVTPAAEGDNPNTVSINEVSTALYSLIVAANGGTAPADLDSFTFVEKSVSPDELIEAAAVVKLITQGGAFALPEGVTNVLELLTNTEAYNNYVEAAEAADPGIIASTITDIIEDPELTPPVDESSLASAYYEIYPAATGFLSRGGNKYNFNADGSGSEVFSEGIHDFEWSLTEGKIDVTYTGDTSSTYFPSVSVGLFGLTQEQVNQLNGAGIFQVEAKQTPLTANLTRIVQGEKTDTYRVIETGTRAMVPITLNGGVVIAPEPVSYEITSDQLLRNADKLGDVKFVAADLDGEWMFEHYYYAGDEGFGYADMFADIFDLNADGTGVAHENDLSFSWELDDNGLFVVTFEDGSYTEITKLDQLGTDVQVFSASYDTEGNLIAADADYALKLDGSDFSTFDQSNPDDMYWNTTINTWSKDSWDGDTLLWDNGFGYFGWQFLEDGTGYQMGAYNMSPPDFEPLFNSPLGWEEEAISEDESIMSINRRMCPDDQTQVCTQRQWRLLKTADGILGPRIYVFEVQDQRASSTSPWYITNGIGPRLNMYEEISFSYWNDTAITPEGAAVTSGVSTTQASVGGKKSVGRLLMEPNQKAATSQ
jgi:hypothetical protein